ncbi:hypothetical protein ACFV29_42150 [Streptomyces sp. NPDC059690]|uniref:hypothetical protein n=1 Tax=Streptomyces sp. NPDC059690 TaxID=3346907 RepID=UPI00369F211B
MPEEVQVSAPRTRNRCREGERLHGELLAAASRLLSELGEEDGPTSAASPAPAPAADDDRRRVDCGLPCTNR